LNSSAILFFFETMILNITGTNMLKPGTLQINPQHLHL
jgi:hypothetical protein